MTSVWNLRQQWPFDYISTHLTPQIITGEGNSVFHSEWDNLNRITTNVHGSNVVNSTKGIMIQEVKESHVSTKKRTLPLYDRSSKMRSRKIKPPEMLPELAFKRAGPNFPNNANFTSPAENQESYGASMLQYNTHLLCRLLSSQGKQQLGADWLVPDELHCEMESFTCIMYGQARMTSVDAVRAKMLRKMVLAQRAESEEQAALDMLADSNNSNNLSVGEEDEEYYHNDEDEVLEEIDLEDLFSDDEEDE
ncbi:hypothetical protein PO909_030347 [Leuciscus waleckii]